MIILIPVIAALIGLALGWALIRFGLTELAWGLCFLLAAVMVWGFYQSQTVQGWDALAYMVVWLMGAAPALLGLAIGAAIGRVRRAKAALGAKPG